MINNYYFLFDMDGTLFFTDELNNESYNYALKKYNLPIIENQKRITREVVKRTYSELNAQQLTKLIQFKQDYFIKNINKVHINGSLFYILRKIKKNNCILWTSAEKKRTEALINEFNLHNFFIRIILSEKKNISQDIKNICSEFSCTYNKLLVFENDPIMVDKLKENNVSCLLFTHS